MTPVCLRTFPLPSSDETPSDGQLAGLTNVPGKFPSPRSILFWPRHHHRMPCTCAVTGRTKLFSWFTAPGQHECLHVLTSALIPLACYQTASILCHLMDTLSPSPCAIRHHTLLRLPLSWQRSLGDGGRCGISEPCTSQAVAFYSSIDKGFFLFITFRG